MIKPVSLSVHRNTRDQRRRHQVSNNLVEFARDMAHRKEIDGFAIVTWDEGLGTNAAWICGKLPESCVPEFVKVSIQRRTGMNDAHNEIYGPPPDDTA